MECPEGLKEEANEKSKFPVIGCKNPDLGDTFFRRVRGLPEAVCAFDFLLDELLDDLEGAEPFDLSFSWLNVQYAPFPFSVGGRGTRTKLLFRDKLCLTEFLKYVNYNSIQS